MNWVLLRGLTREARHWGRFPQQMAQIPVIANVNQTSGLNTPLYQASVLALDLPGNGAFYRQRSPHSVRGTLECARQQLRAQGCQPPYCLLAMSLGGMVAADWAQRYPDEISRLVLVNTSMRPFSRPDQRLRPGNWLPLALLAALWRNADYAERVIHQLTCHPVASPASACDADVAAWVKIRKSAPVSPANAWRQFRAAAGFSCALEPPRCPTLVLSSAGDRLVHPLCSTRVANAWQATHKEHPWAGHDLPHDDPDWVCQRIAGWLGMS